ncbi:hypothetical protein FHR75_004183 [Kineococcus radiotolerans]|uniref:Uncharacterized protein n=1 Tax=Kineococcus radiotolerans TaxID=131568 RepID=A0A7W4TRT3_KINRA|nr:hypothetical protein [Kineococcus radiotolerans]MBB2903341.1 hypothetical protein [Kineococcus radiotolerans]
MTAESGAAGDSVPVQVSLYHCGVEPLVLDDTTWEVPQPPFDGTNAPASFTGSGSVVRDGKVLRYTDEAGALLTFVPDDGVQRPLCA